MQYDTCEHVWWLELVDTTEAKGRMLLYYRCRHCRSLSKEVYETGRWLIRATSALLYGLWPEASVWMYRHFGNLVEAKLGKR
jgi:hypothetical protein